ncbi:hypothetical protein BN903_120 [Halorubrum sp. AJ67]|nr:hypothetical protein BN903_120 [Halorubrum sp. AJ67]
MSRATVWREKSGSIATETPKRTKTRGVPDKEFSPAAAQ